MLLNSRMRRLLASGCFLLTFLSISPLPAQSSTASPTLESSAGSVALPVQDEVDQPRDIPFPGTIKIDVDATDVQRHIFSMREDIPVRGGQALTLLYPQWSPGDHTANGPLEKLAGLVVSANGQRLSWTRDTLSVYAIHVHVPPGVKTLEVSYQYLGSTGPETGASLITRTMFDLQWQRTVLYPAGYYAKDIQFSPTLTLPTGWTFYSSLDGAHRTGDTVQFGTIPLETLADSPVMAGSHARQITLSTEPVPVYLDVVADDDSEFERLAEAAQKFKGLQDETTKLFQSHHYNHYNHMLWLSDELGPVYYEHHRSGENSRPSNFLKGKGPVPSLGFIEHGYVHSWNGMYRRPAEMTTPNLNTPERDSLFWVFEGLTEYWSDVLSARSGMISKEEAVGNFTDLAAYTSITAGAQWRTLQDTSNMPVFAFRKATSWVSWQRNMFDAYSQGELLWLAVDTQIRLQTNGRKSLDDFARTFFAGHDGSDQTSTYTFEEMTAALNHICPYDWAAYLRERLDEYGTEKTLDGIKAGGYRLTYVNAPTPSEEAQSFLNLAFSLGMQVSAGGKIVAVHWKGSAFQAGIIPGGTIVTINGTAYSPALLESAITEATKGSAIHLKVKRFGDTEDYFLDWRGGIRKPQLVRLDNSPALIDMILAPS